MSEKTAIEERSVFEKLEDLKNEVSMCINDIGAMVALGEEVTIYKTEGDKSDIDWNTVFGIIGDMQKRAWEKVNEMDELMAKQGVIERRLLPNVK